VPFVLQLQHGGRAILIEDQLLAFCPKVQAMSKGLFCGRRRLGLSDLQLSLENS
jgi:hypothetical protein